MSIDWTIEWPPENLNADFVPSSKAIIEVLEDFLSGLYSSIDKKKTVWVVTLLGSKSYMFKRHGYQTFGFNNMSKERYFEIWITNSGLTITTRLQDDVTNCLAAEFARRCTSRWDGALSEPS